MLKQIDPEPFSERLSPENARWGWTQALSVITEDGLKELLDSSQERPLQISIVLAHGVFTSALEWLSLSLASGAKVHLKAPSEHSEFAAFLTDSFSKASFPISYSTERTLPPSDLLYAFGTDQSLEEIQGSTLHAKFKGYGHRFSVIISGDSEQEAFKVAKDIIAYDGRGCMAPVGIFCTGDVTRFSAFLFQELLAFHQERPIGVIDPFLKPEIRRRIGLAKIKGQAQVSDVGSVLTLPSRFFFPSSLPRIACVYSIQSIDEAIQILQPWQSHLSSLSTSFMAQRLQDLFPRVVSLGRLQSPEFPRLHDGEPMWID
jgi:hypothetical protein